MKVLFALNNDNVSEAIVKKYQKEYKEILSYKNVYYFNAIYRELQKDKSYSRIIISEDLEPYGDNDYELIDKFLSEKYGKIIEEAKDINGDYIDIIIICADRRKKTDDMIIKMYNNKIYNAIIGQDRSIDEVCRLINNPRDKQEAKTYYIIQENELGETDSENSVSEAEVESIRAHYARLGKNEDKFVESFNNIASQYTDVQLKIIIKYLPMNVKAVLEEKSPKYQQLVVSSGSPKINYNNYKKQTISKKDSKNQEEENVTEQLIKPKKIKSVVIPTNIKTNDVKKVVIPTIEKPEIDLNTKKDYSISSKEEINNQGEYNMTEDEQNNPKRGRGRPRKSILSSKQEEKPKRGRGRPRKQQETTLESSFFDNENNLLQEAETIISEPNTKDYIENKGTNTYNTDEDENVKNQGANLFEEEQEIDLFDIEEENKKEESEIDLFNLDDEDDEKTKEEEIDLFNVEEEENNSEVDLFNTQEEQEATDNINDNFIARTKNLNSNSNFNSLLTGNKKVVAFVGTTKNGTSFIVNNTAEMLASMGIETAILDMTKTKNAYYIYTNNEETLRMVAKNCIKNLQKGICEGIKTKKNLTIYTEVPGDEEPYQIDQILSTLLTKYEAVLIDTDFETSPELFEKVQEIYLVQSMDVLTIQPLTAFLRNLKSKGMLDPEKLKIVVNKSQKVRGLNIRTLIGGMSCYNSSDMSYMTELFNKDNIRYCEVPFEILNYVKYLESLVNCSISLNGYTRNLMISLKELANMVYPLVEKQARAKKNEKLNEPFSQQVNDTLNQMKKKY